MLEMEKDRILIESATDEIKAVVHAIGGTDATDDWSRGWDAAIDEFEKQLSITSDKHRDGSFASFRDDIYGSVEGMMKEDGVINESQRGWNSAVKELNDELAVIRVGDQTFSQYKADADKPWKPRTRLAS